MLANDAFDRFDAFHLRHGNVHEHDVRLGAAVLRDGGKAVAGFAGNFAAEELYHLDDVLAREHRVVHHEIADGLVVFSEQRCELCHDLLLITPGFVSTNPGTRLAQGLQVQTPDPYLFLARGCKYKARTPAPVQERLVDAGILSTFSFLSDLSSRFLSERSNFSWREAFCDARSPPKCVIKRLPIASRGTMRFT